MISITEQPERIEYSTNKYINKGSNKDTDVKIGTGRLVVGEFVFNNVPISVSIETGQIRNLSVSLKSIEDQRGMTENSKVGLSQVITLKYNALSKDLYDSWSKNINKVVQLNLANDIPINYTDKVERFRIQIPGTNPPEYLNEKPRTYSKAVWLAKNAYTLEDEDYTSGEIPKKYIELNSPELGQPAEMGEYRIKNITGKTTLMDEYHDVKVELIKNVEYGDALDWTEGGSDGSLDYVDYETIFDNFNPLDEVVDVSAYINGELIFEGYLDNITSSSLKALGKERDLADVVIFNSYSDYDGDGIVLNSSLTSLARDSLEKAGYSLNGEIDGEGLDANIIDTSVWNIISRCCKDVGMYFYAEGNQVHVNRAHTQTTDVTGNFEDSIVDINDKIIYKIGGLSFSTYSLAESYAISNGLSTDNIEEGVKTTVISTNTNFKGSKKYDSIIINANYRFFFDNWALQDVNIKCRNKMIIAGEGLDYSKMESVPTSQPVTDETSFDCFVDMNDNPYDIAASETNYSFIPSTMPDTETKNIDTYWGTIDIKIDQELAPIHHMDITTGIGVNASSTFDDNADYDTFFSKTWMRNEVPTFDGNAHFHIFEIGDVDQIGLFTILLKNVKLPPEDLYDGYRKWDSGLNIYTHSFCYKQSIGSENNLDSIAFHLISLKNAQLKEMTFICKGIIDVRPGSYVNYKGKNFYISSVTYKIDKNQVITTSITGNEYKEYKDMYPHDFGDLRDSDR